ncbi:E3 ubiquitin-protein ligase ATL31-like [Typha angustifolia]|uniref:E3 ubiquitin-protein ligase ATL31-like n=1 Tax=Typha angustifolia TaxID=59011 RepID=UPI003C2B16E4
MGTNPRRATYDGAVPFLFLLLLFLATAPCGHAQPPPPSDNTNGYFGPTSFNPSMAIVIVVLISAFFFLGFFSIYIRQCAGDRIGAGTGGNATGGAGALTARSRRQRGLDPAVLETFPTMEYSKAKELKIGKGALECAVCLSEFEDDETLRLLPKCSHVFHPDCIDAWLESHVTCPVCRCNLVPDPNAATTVVETAEEPTPAPHEVSEEERHDAPPATAPEHAVVIDVDREESEEDRTRKDEAVELERIGSLRRAMRSKSGRRPGRFPRSHSTGHSLSAAVVRPGENLDRFTLRLPEHVRKEIVAAGKLKRTTSLLAFPTAREGSTRSGYRGGGAAGEGSSRGGRSIRLGRSDRWPSFLARTLSAKFPAWATGRRGEGEGFTKGKLGSVKGPFDCLGGGSSAAEEDESPIAARRV